jgi:hypothetical protein
MTTLTQIHSEIDRLSERRTWLRHELSAGHDPAIVAEINEISEKLDRLWDEHRAVRATIRWGERDAIIKRARQEERLERAA